VKEKMKSILVFAFACLFYGVSADAEQSTTPPQHLVDFKQVKNGLQTKNELVGRFFKLLTSGSAEPSEKPRDKSTSPYIVKSFRRLNIFGLQAPPDEPQRDSDGRPCSCDPKQLVPDILHLPEVAKNEPKFSVVWPQSNDNQIQKSVELPVANQLQQHQQYPKLDLDALFQQPQGTAEHQPFSYQYQSVPRQAHYHT
jgi:hypothetical protein